MNERIDTMNKFIGMGRLTADPEIRHAQNGTAVATYTLAINRRYRRDGEPNADFIPCVSFGKSAEFAQKYLSKGMQIAVVGGLQIYSYTDKDGNRRYKTDIVVEEHYFAESKKTSETVVKQATDSNTGFYPIDEDIDNSVLPFEV